MFLVRVRALISTSLQPFDLKFALVVALDAQDVMGGHKVDIVDTVAKFRLHPDRSLMSSSPFEAGELNQLCL